MSREYYIFQEIGYYGITALQFAKDMDEYKDDDLTIYIASPGGEVFQGLAMYDIIKRRKGKTTAIITGYAASMASVIALAADEVHMTESAYYMIHNPMTWTAGNADDISKEIDLLRQLELTMVNIYQRKTGLDESVIKEYLKNETWFNAKDALKAGFIDKIINDDEAHGRAVALSGAVWQKYAYRNTPAALKEQTNKQGVKMKEEKTTPEAIEPQAVTYTDEQVQAKIKTATEEAIKAERQRVTQIRELAFEGQEKLVEKLISENVTADVAAIQIIADYKQNGMKAVITDKVENLLDRHASAPVPVADEPKSILAQWEAIRNPVQRTAFYKENKIEIEKELRKGAK